MTRRQLNNRILGPIALGIALYVLFFTAAGAAPELAGTGCYLTVAADPEAE